MEPTTFHEIDMAPGQHSALLAPYDLEITIDGKIRIEVGRFSLGLVPRVRVLADEAARCLLRIGSFCEIAHDGLILVGGEHRSDSLLNFTFGGQGKVFRAFMDAENKLLGSVKEARVSEIGDNVVISAGAVVLDGASIGTGCVIGAATAIRKADPYGIYAGAMRICDRFPAERLALYQAARLPDIMAHHLPTLPAILGALESGAMTLEQYLAAMTFLPARPTVHLQAKLGPEGAVLIGAISGYSVGGIPVSADNAARLGAYFSQLDGRPRVRWLPDIFAALGLY